MALVSEHDIDASVGYAPDALPEYVCTALAKFPIDKRDEIFEFHKTVRDALSALGCTTLLDVAQKLDVAQFIATKGIGPDRAHALFQTLALHGVRLALPEPPNIHWKLVFRVHRECLDEFEAGDGAIEFRLARGSAMVCLVEVCRKYGLRLDDGRGSNPVGPCEVWVPDADARWENSK